MRIVLLGAPGSGKRTQTALIMERYGIPAISTGELLKSAVATASPLGLQIKETLEEGKPVTEEIVLELIRERLMQADTQSGFILDGFPRNILQAITLDELLFEMELPIELALLIDIETDALMERLVGRRTCKSCGAQYNIYTNPTAVEGVCDQCGGGLRQRADDNEATISNRLHVYDHLVAPLIKHYTRQEKLQRIDAQGEVDEVFARICQAVDNFQPPVHGSEQADISVARLEVTEQMADSLALQAEAQAATDTAELAEMLENDAKKSRTVKKKAVTAKKKAVKKKPAASNKTISKKQAAAGKKTVKKQSVTKQTTAKTGSKKATAKKSTKTKSAQPAKPAVVKKPSIKRVAVKKATSKKGGKKQVVAKQKPSKKLPMKKPSAKKKSARKK